MAKKSVGGQGTLEDTSGVNWLELTMADKGRNIDGVHGIKSLIDCRLFVVIFQVIEYEQWITYSITILITDGIVMEQKFLSLDLKLFNSW